jgi:hypothetical protein
VTPLNLDCSITSDSGQLGQWQYYSFTIQTLKFVDIEITAGVTSGLDLYALADNLPTVFFWEHFVSGSGKNKLSFFLPPDHNGTYFLGLFMTATTSFSLSVCPKDPNFPSMTSGVTYNRTLELTDDYYFIDVVDPNVDVIVLSVNDSDNLVLYLSQGVLPTEVSVLFLFLSPFLYKTKNKKNNKHTKFLTSPFLQSSPNIIITVMLQVI